jgi:CelD/BcsL family acetyltransferase involved in cellulose biosynthesis
MAKKCMVTTEIIDPLADARWDAIETRPEATLYHSRAWARVLAETYGFRPRYYLLQSGREVLGGLPFFEVGGGWRGPRLVSLPFSDSGGPIGERPAVEALLEAAVADARKLAWKTLEIRGAIGAPPGVDLVEAQHADNYTLALDRPLCDLARGLADSVKWGRKRALRAGVSVERVNDVEGLREFYRLHQITRRRLGVPVQSWRFFQLVAREFLEKDMGLVVHARHGGRAIASAVFLRFGTRLYYKFSASDPRRLALQPNSLVLWEAIDWASRVGLAEFDLGKTVRENTGLARFKRSWGARPVALPHYYFPRVAGLGAESEHARRMRMARAVWRRLPLPLTRLVGSLVYRTLA